MKNKLLCCIIVYGSPNKNFQFFWYVLTCYVQMWLKVLVTERIIKTRVEFAKAHFDKPQSSSVRTSFCRIKQYENFLIRHQFTVEKKKNLSQKKTPPPLSHIGELFSGVVLLHLAQDALNLCRAQ